LERRNEKLAVRAEDALATHIDCRPPFECASVKREAEEDWGTLMRATTMHRVLTL